MVRRLDGDLEVAADAVVEQRAENAGRIEVGQTAPVDGAVDADQGDAVQIADDAIVRDGFESYDYDPSDGAPNLPVSPFVDQHRTGSVAQGPLGHAAEHQMFQAGAVVAAHNDHRSAMSFRFFGDGRGRVAGTYHAG